MRIFTLLFALCLCLALTVFFLSEDTGTFDPGAPADASSTVESKTVHETQQVGDFSQSPTERAAVTPMAAPSLPADLCALELSGRVVDSQGAGVAAAEVALYVTESAFAGGNTRARRERGSEGRSQGGRDRMAQIRETMAKRRKLEVATQKTDREGRFVFRKPAFTASALELTVTHDMYAPKLVREGWEKKDGSVELKDIVLPIGGTVRGVVIDQNEVPIGDAEVSFANSSNRGGRGGRGRRTRGGSERLAKLIQPVRTDAAGKFELRHVPPGRLEVKADADRFLPSASRSIRLADSEVVEDQVIQLTMGTALMGRVSDKSGNPIEGAVVIARVSRAAERARSEAARTEAKAQRRTGQTISASPNVERTRSRRGRTEKLETVTDTEGRFAFDAVPFLGVTLKVEHAHFIPEQRDPLIAEQDSSVNIMMHNRVSARGVILDAVTGQPIEIFGIAARKVADSRAPDSRAPDSRGPGSRAPDSRAPDSRAPGSGDEARGFGRRNEQGGRGRRGGNRTANNASRNQNLEQARARASKNPEVAARIAQAEERQQAAKSRRAQQDSYWQNLLGQSGMVAGKTPAPSRHNQGEFSIDFLLPGRYVFDIDSPDYVRIAAGFIEIEAGISTPLLTFILEPGRDIAGRVVDSAEQTAVAKAQVELYLPKMQELPQAQNNAALRDLFRRGQSLGKRIAETRTDAQGQFKLHAQKPGRYILRVRATDHLTFVESNFSINAESQLLDLRIPLDTGARVYGRITDLAEGASATVELTHTDGKTYSGRVDREMGIYSIQGLPAGGYFVKISAGRDRGNRGGRGRGGDQMTSRLAVAQGRQPQLYVTENQKLRYDTTIEPTDLGKIHGLVQLNGEAANGFEVQLKPRTEIKGDRTERALGQIISRLFSARTDRDGHFEIDGILPGSYLMNIQRRSGRGRGGRGGSQNSMHVEPIEVVAGVTLEPVVHIEIGSLAIELRDQETGAATSSAQLAIVEAGGVDTSNPKSWRKAPTYQKLRLRNSDVKLTDLAVGTYLFSVTGRGIKPQTGTLQIVPGVSPTMTIKVEKQTDQDILNAMDKDGDGHLSADELPGRLKSQFSTTDKNSDGKVSLTEFTAARAAQQAERKTQKAGGKQAGSKQTGGKQTGGKQTGGKQGR